MTVGIRLYNTTSNTINPLPRSAGLSYRPVKPPPSFSGKAKGSTMGKGKERVASRPAAETVLCCINQLEAPETVVAAREAQRFAGVNRMAQSSAEAHRLAGSRAIHEPLLPNAQPRPCRRRKEQSSGAQTSKGGRPAKAAAHGWDLSQLCACSFIIFASASRTVAVPTLDYCRRSFLLMPWRFLTVWFTPSLTVNSWPRPIFLTRQIPIAIH